MKQSIRTNKNTKIDFERVYESPLDWCPIFGFVPEIKNTYLVDVRGVLPYNIGVLCGKIISEARLFLISYLNINEVDHYINRFIALPNIKPSVWPRNACMTIRRLFQRLDHIALLSSNAPYIVNIRTTGGIPELTVKSKPIGRISNRAIDITALSCAADIINLIEEGYSIETILLSEARKITRTTVALDLSILFALFAILEAWITLTTLLFNPIKDDSESRRIFKLYQKAQYGNDLLNRAETHAQAKFTKDIVKMTAPLINEKNKQSLRMKINRKSRQPLQALPLLLKELIQYYRNENKRISARTLFEYLFKNIQIDENLINSLRKGEVVMTCADIAQITLLKLNRREKWFLKKNNRRGGLLHRRSSRYDATRE